MIGSNVEKHRQRRHRLWAIDVICLCIQWDISLVWIQSNAHNPAVLRTFWQNAE